MMTSSIVTICIGVGADAEGLLALKACLLGFIGLMSSSGIASRIKAKKETWMSRIRLGLQVAWAKNHEKIMCRVWPLKYLGKTSLLQALQYNIIYLFD